MPDQVAPIFPLADPSIFVRPMQSKKPAAKSPLDDWIARTLKEGAPEYSVGPNSFDVYRYLRTQAAQGPNPEDVKAGQADVEAQSAAQLLQQLQGIHTPERPMMTAPNVTPLTLPGVPQRQRPQAEPVSALAAGILGLVSPQYAGDFGAAALHGAIQENERQNQAKQDQFA